MPKMTSQTNKPCREVWHVNLAMKKKFITTSVFFTHLAMTLRELTLSFISRLATRWQRRCTLLSRAGNNVLVSITICSSSSRNNLYSLVVCAKREESCWDRLANRAAAKICSLSWKNKHFSQKSGSLGESHFDGSNWTSIVSVWTGTAQKSHYPSGNHHASS